MKVALSVNCVLLNIFMKASQELLHASQCKRIIMIMIVMAVRLIMIMAIIATMAIIMTNEILSAIL